MSTSTSRDVTVDRPINAVAAYLCDFTTTAQWDPHTVSCRRLDDGPLQVGARYENVQRIAGRESTLTYTVTDYEPGKRIVLEGGNDTLRTHDEMTFTETATGGTTVTYAVDVELHGLAKAGTPMLSLAIKKIADEGAEGMHRQLQTL
ncbi:MAG: Polyketide cyclase/dehydrase [Pseudonocardiales bacterium]|nr:Polyketide cyclase/dehydrase [Pseudonocardiales bacterium]